MKSIAFLKNFEVCNVNGDTVYADIFIERIEKSVEGRDSIDFHIFEAGSQNFHSEDFHDNEMDAWTENLTFYDVCEDESSVTINKALSVFYDMLSGALGPIAVPSLPYMANDESSMTERDGFESEYFFAVLNTEMREKEGTKTL